jgi:hypothetical protein
MESVALATTNWVVYVALTCACASVRNNKMATHEISLEIPHGIRVVNTDIEVQVREDGKLLGRVRISRGSIDWVPANGRYVKYMRWSRFARLMADHGYDRKMHS